MLPLCTLQCCTVTGAVWPVEEEFGWTECQQCETERIDRQAKCRMQWTKGGTVVCWINGMIFLKCLCVEYPR